MRIRIGRRGVSLMLHRVKVRIRGVKGCRRLVACSEAMTTFLILKTSLRLCSDTLFQ